MKFILQNDNQVRYFKVTNVGKEQILAEVDLFFELHQVILDYPTFKETAEDIKMFAEDYDSNNLESYYHLSNEN